MARTKDRLFIAVGGHIVAVDTATGEEIWRTKLKTAATGTVWMDTRRVYGGAGGELYCLDPATGSILWHNRLKGLGIGVVAFPGSAVEEADSGLADAVTTAT